MERVHRPEKEAKRSKLAMREVFDKLQWLTLFGFGIPVVFIFVSGLVCVVNKGSTEDMVLIGVSLLLGLLGMVGVWGKKRYG